MCLELTMQLPAAEPAAPAARELKQVSTRGMRAAVRLGYATRGLVYGLIGTLSLLWSLRQTSGRITDGHGAVEHVGQYGWGLPLLWAIAFGLGCYAAWNLFRALFDPEHRGRDTKGVAKRVGYLVSAAAQGFLAAYTFQLAIGEAHGSGSERSLAQLLSLPGGRIAIGIAGLIVIGFGVFQLYLAFKSNVTHEYGGGIPPNHDRLITHVARLGVAARGVVFPLIGFSLIAAAYAADPSRAHGFGDALHDIAHQTYGRVLLGVVAAGLVAYGAHMFLLARYARLPIHKD